MLKLLETIIGFAAIMLVLSFLVKSLTSVIKSYVDFYTSNLKHEVNRLVLGTLGKSWDTLKKDPVVVEKAPWIRDINWKRLGEEYLTKQNIEWVLRKLSSLIPEITDIEEKLKGLEGRIAVHLGNIKYAFEKRIKGVTIVVGVGLCLAFNINAFSIWGTLYKDFQIRSEFTGTYVESALAMAENSKGNTIDQENQTNQSIRNTTGGNDKSQSTPQSINQEREKLAERTDAVITGLKKFQSDVSFGAGRMWRAPPKDNDWFGFLYEFFGSLLTGIFISIGAPYWHDLLRALSGIRRPKKT